jgi:hypothetical protein
MANFKTYITEQGWRTLLNGGLLNSITSFKAGDETIIYGIEENNIKPAFYDILLTGNREGTTTIPSCSLAQRKSVPLTPPQPEEIRTLDSRVKLAFISEDCNIPFEKNNLTVRVNIDKWIDDLLNLKATSYNRNASGLKIHLWDYIVGYLEEYNAGTKVWYTKETYQSNIDISYKLLSQKDINTYSLVNPKYMELGNGGQKLFVNGQTKTRFASPMVMAFNTKSIDGVDVFGTSNTLGLYPDSWGYVADGSYINSGDLENIFRENPNAYKQIYPAIKINNNIYQLKTDSNYTTKDGVGYMVWGYKDSNNTPAIDGLTNKLKLFMKANGEELQPGVYRMIINFSVGLKGGKTFNGAYQNKRVGGELAYELYYNENTVSTDLYTIS